MRRRKVSKEAFFSNAPKKRRRKVGVKRRRKSVARRVARPAVKRRRRVARRVAAPVAAPKRRRTRKRRSSVRVTRRIKSMRRFHRGRKHTVRVYETGRRRWRRSRRSLSRRAGIRINAPMVIAGANRPRRRHGRHNPAVLGLLRGPFDVMKGMPQLLTGAIGGITASIVPSFVPMAADNRFVRYGVEGAVAIVGGTVVARFLGRQHGIAWTVGGMTILLIEVLKNEVMSRIPYFQGLSDYTVIQDYTVEGNNEIEAFPGDGMTVGAFPSMMTSPY